MAESDGNSAKRPTIYDLAEIAGTSPSAVSSILNGTWKKRRISEKLAKRVSRIAAEQGYAVNLQASLLRRERSRIIGMIVPKYDNRYFGAIAEQFEIMARARGLFPVITCTQRDPELEFEAARELISYQAECLIVTGATDADRIGEFCAAAGVRAINLDLPGRNAPSIVSDNFTGARDLASLILSRMKRDFGEITPLWFIGGRSQDHNTAERLRGFKAAHRQIGLPVPSDQIIMPGYSPHKAIAAMTTKTLADRSGLFVNSTITLEGVIHWLNEQRPGPDDIRLGCFDWDPFAALLPQNVGMTEQNVSAMLETTFELVETPPAENVRIEVPCILREIGGPATAR
ncbi:substrate-binding domain-containing protein [Paracoccus saliphilus]|uniref:LacI family DNA-binding transcriptional regulator n=1 Tax=Paracoccus saliphilus TaxID=405559 RepID=A0AA45W4H7_9RHOB|nr:LacI family DNA-binding transcriptional regulator [Paracoccus saliphilus]WCR04105.1 LacI family DNA-binding transcriptional regulator [Paracoccus saliphilus]SIS85046.1 transcriptional regulator, LacI family [Paracoccus saliphilus]